jgi:hypothetical protein
MAEELASTHYFTVRGQGFDLEQWSAIGALAEKVAEKAQDGVLKTQIECDVRCLKVTPSGEGEPLVIWRDGQPDVPQEINTSGKFDLFVQTLFTLIKKVAPDIFVMTSPDGRDYRKVLARRYTPSGHGNWAKIKDLSKIPENRYEAFLYAMSRKKHRNPATGNMVSFVTLPKIEQTRLRKQWEQLYGNAFDKALEKMKSERDEAMDTVEDAAEAVDDFKDVQDKAEKAKEMNKKANSQLVRRAAIRVAAETKDPQLKRRLLDILKPKTKAASEDSEDEKEARWAEGEKVDMGEWLKENGHKEDAEKWDKHHGQVHKSSSVAVCFPEVYDLAWKHVIGFHKSNPNSKTASGSTAMRVKTTDKLAEQWVQDAVKKPGRVREYLNIPEGQKIPMAKLDSAIEKVRKEGDKSLLSALLLAKRFKKGLD